MTQYLPFQKRFINRVIRGREDIYALSIPRGNGKSFLGSELGAMALTPGTKLWRRGSETVLCAGSIEQCRIVYRATRAILEMQDPDAYRFVDSATRVAITHKKTGTRLRALGSNAKTSFGLVGVPLVIFDEPGVQDERNGQLLWDSVRTALGKYNSKLRVILIGTLAPAKERNWWPELVKKGTKKDIYVQALIGRRDKWRQWREILRCNPIARVSKETAERLRIERDEAWHDPRALAAFLSYRLNLPTADETEVLLTVQEWERSCARPVPARDGTPLVSVDIGASRAWSAATAFFPSGRIEAVALAPGIPSIEDQEDRDYVPRGEYRRLVEKGTLLVAKDVHVPEPEMLWEVIVSTWGVPTELICDYFKEEKLKDCVQGACTVTARRTRWSESTNDIRATRKHFLDGPFVVAEESRELVEVSLTATMVKNEEGNSRLVKSGSNNAGRDDVSSAMVIGAGAWARGDIGNLRDLYLDLARNPINMTVEPW